MNGTRRRALGAAVAGAILVPWAIAGMASADPGAASHVDSIAATAGPGSISVSGQATFVDASALVGEDSTGDATVAGLGMDMSTVKISRAPGTNTLKFTLGIADQPQTLFGVPEVVMYQWDLAISAPGGEARIYKLAAGRTGQAQSAGANPYFRRYTCVLDPQTNVNNCSNAVTLTGKVADGVVEWNVPMSQLGATAGEKITASGEGITVVPTTSGAFWGLVAFDQATQDEDYVVPGPTVKLGIATAGTPASQVPLSENATVNGTGAFSGIVPRPSQSGEYVIVAQACYGANSCGVSTTTVTI